MTTSPVSRVGSRGVVTEPDLRDLRAWEATALGPVEGWPAALRTAAGICLESRFPILVWWGPELRMLYNDAYRPILGDKHPASMGAAGREVWPEIWHVIGPMLEGVLGRGEATWSEDQLLLLNRQGFAEECYFTFSYSPIRDGDGVTGIFTAVTETTARVTRERRLATIRSLAAGARTVDGAVEAAMAAIGAASKDIPFAVIELEDGERRVMTVGVAEEDLRPDVLTRWRLHGSLAEAVTGDARVVSATEVLRQPVDSEWGPPVTTAMLVPLEGGSGQRLGTLVLGSSPALPLDDEYLDFLNVAGDRVDAAIADARAIESERRRAEALAALDAAKTTFFANVSHELRTPLALMLGPLGDLAASETVGDADRERAEMAVRNGRRMRRLVDNLLDVMRLEAGRIEPRLQPVDLGALSASIASMFDGAYERAGLTLEVVTSPTAHATAVDPELWERIVANLLANALKYTREGGVRVLVDEDGGRSRVRVTDTGLGIPPDDLPRIFERFVRLDQPGARSQEGSGIGLALTAELVRLHGGTIGAESNPGRGTTFTVTLPVAAPTATATATTRPGTPAVRGARRATGSVLEDVEDWLRDDAAPSADDASVDADAARGALRGAHILVVDDNRDMRAYLRRLLGGARVTAVGSAASAMSVLRAQRVDLLVADVMLPGMSGTDLVREVRRDPSLASLPIVMLSARAGEEASLDGLAAGADDYLVKPFTPTELVGRIAARLATARERRRTETALETVHRQLERQVAILDTVVFASPVGIGVWDADLRCLIVNERLAALNELPIEDHLGRTPEEYLPDRWPLYQPYFEAALAGTPTLGVEFEGRHPTTGEWQAVVASYYPLRDDGGPVYGVALACVDVTEGRERERQLQDALSAKDEFLGLVSHELRTPLTTILGAARVLTDRAGSLGEAQRRELLGDLSGEAERLNRIVENLLTLARLSAGHAPELEPVLVGRVVHRVVESRMRDLPDRPIRLQVDRPDAPASAHAGYVEQVIANLVSNADKYSEAGEPIDVHVRHEGDEVLVSVADRGAGIGPDEAERLFDPFYRSPRTAAKAGLGIGLTVCRRLVEAQGGRLWVEPRRDGGSVFSVALPAAAAED